MSLTRLLALLVLVTAAQCGEGDRYLLPAAVGDGDGRAWDHAAGADTAQVAAMIASLPAGACLALGSGVYPGLQLVLDRSGSAGAPLIIRGVDTGAGLPELVGDWTRSDPGRGSDLVVLKAGASHLVVEQLRIRAYRRAVYSRDGGHLDLRFADLEIRDVRSGFYLIGGAAAGDPERLTRELLIERCSIVGYTKRGLRLQDGNHHVTVREVVADMGDPSYAVERFAIGFHVIGDADAKRDKRSPLHDHHIAFERCVARNHYDPNGDAYWNADGFAAEGGCHAITYTDCVAESNTDGGWDDKSTSPVLTRCTARANKRNYRFWTREGSSAQMIDCVATGAVKTGGSGDAVALWTKGTGQVLATGCTFSDNPKVVSIEGDDAASVELRHCRIERSPGQGLWSQARAAQITTVDCTGLDDPAPAESTVPDQP